MSCPALKENSEGFGVCVDLSVLFSDERARWWVWVEHKRSVYWLIARLRRRLSLPPNVSIALAAPLGLLHPHDPLALLRAQDTVRVIITSSEWFPEEDENSSGSESTSPDTLQLVKRRALALLDRVATSEIIDATVTSPTIPTAKPAAVTSTTAPSVPSVATTPTLATACIGATSLSTETTMASMYSDCVPESTPGELVMPVRACKTRRRVRRRPRRRGPAASLQEESSPYRGVSPAPAPPPAAAPPRLVTRPCASREPRLVHAIG